MMKCKKCGYDNPIGSEMCVNCSSPLIIDVFISYSRRDYVDSSGKLIRNNIISYIKDSLTAEGISYWFDEDGIYSGDEFASIITKAIRNSKVFLFVSSKNSNASEWTSNEISAAMEFKKTIIPFRIDNSPYNDSVMMKIISLDYIECKNRDRAIAQLIRAIKHRLQVRREYKEVKAVPAKVSLEMKFQRLFNNKLSKKILWATILITVGSLIFFLANSNKYRLGDLLKVGYDSSILKNDEAKVDSARDFLTEDSSGKDGLEEKMGIKDGVKVDQNEKEVRESVPERKHNGDKEISENTVLNEEDGFKLYLEGRELYSRNRYSDAYNKLSQSAELGDPKGINALGVCFLHGNGTNKDCSKAVKLFREAARLGDDNAMNNLGDCYLKGQGVERNYYEAVRFFQQAAAKGNAKAQNNLGYCYTRGYGVSQNYTEAVKWYKKASEQGEIQAMHNLGLCYYNGYGVSANTDEAIELFKQSARMGHKSSIEHLNTLGIPW